MALQGDPGLPGLPVLSGLPAVTQLSSASYLLGLQTAGIGSTIVFRASRA